MKRICKECGKSFELTESEINFYSSKNLHLPKRCKNCRNKNNKKTEKLFDMNKLNYQNSEFSNSGNLQNSEELTNNYESTYNPVNVRPVSKPKPVGKILVAAAIALILLAAGGLFILNNNKDQNISSSETASDTVISDTVISDTVIPDTESTSEAVADNTESKDESALSQDEMTNANLDFHFKNETYLEDHYNKHGISMGYDSKEAYEAGANAVILDKDSLIKEEAEDGDYVIYLERTNEIVFVSKRGVIRTYFKPDSGKAYYDRQ